ncbi:alpha/beta-hydrolase, partial [Byssothecium circinans]
MRPSSTSLMIVLPAKTVCLSASGHQRRLVARAASLPVIAWLYGGGFYTGGANVPYQNPIQWVERSQKHIVVSINYRLNIFGFPNGAGLASTEQNLGFLDQRLGLEWIRSNIANFGGDPKRITLWGQSAGAMSADFYNFAYPEDPIVHGYILHSGTAQIALSVDANNHSNFTYVASHLGCANLTAAAELSCLRRVPEKEIISFIENQSNTGVVPSLAFSYVPDNRIIFPNYTTRALSGRFSKKPALIGTTTNEGAAFAAYDRTSGPDPAEATFYTLSTFLCPTVQTTRDRYAAGAPTFRYLYGGNFSNISPQWWEGAYHSSDLPLVFGTSGIARGESTSFEKEVQDQMQDYWVAFAEDPVGGLKRVGWEEYEPEGGGVLFAWEGVVRQGIGVGKLEGACEGLVPKEGARPP